MTPEAPMARASEAQPRAGGRWRRRLAALLVGGIVGCALLEVLVLLLFGEQVKFPRRVVGAPWGLRFNEPNATYRHRSADVDVAFRINGQGMRADRDYAYAKPPGTRRILALGDSFTIGYEVSLEDCYAARLERLLGDAGMQVEILNAGVSGFSTAEEMLYFERELHKYSPDLVIVGFCPNDIGDNVRSGLFRLDDGVLVQFHESYVPGGRLGDFLNRNMLMSWLGERSNAFAMVKEALTAMVKGSLLQRHERALIDEQPVLATAPAEADQLPLQLAGAIFERFYRRLNQDGIPLLIVSIPAHVGGADGELYDLFPLDHFDIRRPGIHYADCKTLLEPHRGVELLYWLRSHRHWTPFSHRIVAEHLAARITAGKLLELR